MSEDMAEQGGERGLVRIQRASNGQRTWAVTARVGERAEDLRQAYEAAREIEVRLAEDDPPPKSS